MLRTWLLVTLDQRSSIYTMLGSEENPIDLTEDDPDLQDPIPPILDLSSNHEPFDPKNPSSSLTKLGSDPDAQLQIDSETFQKFRTPSVSPVPPVSQRRPSGIRVVSDDEDEEQSGCKIVPSHMVRSAPQSGPPNFIISY